MYSLAFISCGGQQEENRGSSLKKPQQTKVPITLEDLYDPVLVNKSVQNNRDLLKREEIGDTVSMYWQDRVVAQIDVRNFKAEIKKHRNDPGFFTWSVKPSVITKKGFTKSQYRQTWLELAALLYPNDESLYHRDLLDLSQFELFFIEYWLQQLAANHSQLIDKFKHTDVRLQPIYIQEHFRSDNPFKVSDLEQFLALVFSAVVPFKSDFGVWINDLPEKIQHAIYSHTSPYLFLALDKVDYFNKALQFYKYKSQIKTEGFIYNIGHINGVPFKNPSLFSNAIHLENYKSPLYLYNTHIISMPKSERDVYLKDFLQAKPDEHPITHIIKTNNPPFNLILFLLEIEPYPQRIKNIYQEYKDKIIKHPKAYEIVQAFVIYLLKHGEKDFVLTHMPDIASEIITAQQR